MLALIYTHYRSKLETGYTDVELLNFETWARDQAALQVWEWGFKQEFEDYINLKPDTGLPKWYKAINAEVSVEVN